MININGKTKLLGVIGDPIEHTLSPVIHNTLSELLGINAVYMPIHVRKAENVPGASDRNDIDNANKANKASDSEPMCTNIENAISGYNTDDIFLHLCFINLSSFIINHHTF